jgi:hypothetical protein
VIRRRLHVDDRLVHQADHFLERGFGNIGLKVCPAREGRMPRASQ